MICILASFHSFCQIMQCTCILQVKLHSLWQINTFHLIHARPDTQSQIRTGDCPFCERRFHLILWHLKPEIRWDCWSSWHWAHSEMAVVAEKLGVFWKRYAEMDVKKNTCEEPQPSFTSQDVHGTKLQMLELGILRFLPLHQLSTEMYPLCGWKSLPFLWSFPVELLSFEIAVQLAQQHQATAFLRV